MAKSKIIINNDKIRVTNWFFKPGEETGEHVHEYDYLVIPMVDGILKIINEDGSVSMSELNKGLPYFRQKGTKQNVITTNKFEYSFIEVEIKFSV